MAALQAKNVNQCVHILPETDFPRKNYSFPASNTNRIPTNGYRVLAVFQLR